MSTTIANDPALPQLRSIAYRITALPSTDLARFVPHLAFQLSPCRSILTNPQVPSSDAAATVHQIKTRVSSLLQDRTEEARFAGVALVKCLVELGGWEILHTSASWVRSMISILGRPSDATVTKKMCILALVRIFQLTHQYDNLVREITTPNLPPYINACLSVLNAKDGKIWTTNQESLLETILRSWAELMPKHPTIFRPFISQIRRLLGPLVATSEINSNQSKEFTPEILDAARKVFVLLHGSATKNGDLEDRESGVNTTLRAAKNTTRRLFRSLYGDEDSRIRIIPGHTNGNSHNDPEEVTTIDLIRQLELLASYIDTNNTKPSAIPIGAIISLLSTITSASATGTKANSRLAKNARQNLLADFPALHLTALKVGLSIVNRYKDLSTSIARDLLDCAISVLENNVNNVAIRPLVYSVTEICLALIGYDLSEKRSHFLNPVIRQCCKDLLPLEPDSIARATTKEGKAITNAINPNALIGSTSRSTKHALQLPALAGAAQSLLQALFTHLKAGTISATIRTEMERTAIVTRSSDALIAAVLNPSNGAPSLLPFAVTLCKDNSSLEGILRPRVPVMRGSSATSEEEDQQDEIMADVDTSNKPSEWAVAQDRIARENSDTEGEKKHSLDNEEVIMPFKRARLDLDTHMPPVATTQRSHSAADDTAPIVPDVDTDGLYGKEAGVADEVGDGGDNVVRIPDGKIGKTAVEQESSDDDDDDDDFVMPPLVLDPRVL